MSPQRYDRVRALLATGMAQKDIALEAGVSASYVSQVKSGDIKRPKTERERFDAKVKRTEGCWEWQGYRLPVLETGRGGYGTVLDCETGSKTTAHRKAYELYVGPIPDGLVVLHVCDNRGCVRPDHLRIGTPQDNTQDMLAKGRGRWQRAA